MRGLPPCWLLLCCNVLDTHLLYFSVELERRLVVVIKRDRRPQGDADVEAIVRREGDRCRYRNLAGRNHSPIDLHGDVERSTWPEHCIRRLDLDLHLTNGELLLGADLGALDDKEVVFVAENAVLHEAGEATGVRTQFVEHAVGVGWDLGVDGDDVGPITQGWCAELRDAYRVSRERPTRIGRRNAVLGVQCDDPKPSANRKRLVLRRFNEKGIFQLCQLLRHLGGKVVCLAPVFLQVIKFPNVIVGCPLFNAWRGTGNPRETWPNSGSHPAIMV